MNAMKEVVSTFVRVGGVERGERGYIKQRISVYPVSIDCCMSKFIVVDFPQEPKPYLRRGLTWIWMILTI